MRGLITALVLASTFCLTSSFRSSAARTLYSKTTLSSESLQNGKKSAFYTKNSDPMVTSDVVATSIGDDREAAKEVIEANPLKIRLMEEVTKEDIRALQLESLLEAFQSAVDEKEQLIVLESVILEDIREVKLKVDDEIILKELTNAIDDKRRMIDSEKVICKEITAVSVSLAKEILETRNKIEKLQNFVATFPENFGNDGKEGAQSYEMLLQSSIESSRSRDESVLELINAFDEATNPIMYDDTILKESSNYGLDQSVPSTSTAIARLSLEQVREEIKNKSNSELASSAGQAVGKSATALVAATASIFTATASFIKSPEAKLSTDSIKSASYAISDMGKNIKVAWSAASKAWDQQDNEEGVNRLIEGVKSIFSSAEVKIALGLLGSNAQKTATDARLAAEVASKQLGKSLKNSNKWKNAVSDLNDSLALLLSILSLSGTRLLAEVRADLNKQLPQ